jgi:diadenosine tetraphosphate (Ap4A) HIT family hydrolase
LKECVFCTNIVSGKEAHIFYRNERIIGFMDRFPVEEGHSLIIPVKHYENIFSIEEDVYLEIQNLARYLSKALVEVFDADGINIGQNNGECARQVVMHYHLHIIPRHCGNDIRWDRLKMTPLELEDQARKIKKALDRIIKEES